MDSGPEESGLVRVWRERTERRWCGWSSEREVGERSEAVQADADSTHKRKLQCWFQLRFIPLNHFFFHQLMTPYHQQSRPAKYAMHIRIKMPALAQGNSP